MPAETSTIDFVIAAHNAARTIARTLEALCAQSDPRWNAIIVDDGSTDDTARIGASHHDLRIRVLSQSNRGPSAARNRGYRASNGPCVCFLDSDDTIHPDFVAKMTPMARRSPLGASCGYSYVDQDAGVLFGVPAMSNDRLAEASMLTLDPPAIMSMVYRRAALDRLLGSSPLFDESLRAFEDWDMLFRVVHNGSPAEIKLGRVDESLASYFCEPNSLSSDLSKVWSGGSEILRKYSASDAEFQTLLKPWSIGVLAGCMIGADHPTSTQIQAAIDPIVPADLPRLARSLRWHAMRRYAIPFNKIEVRHPQICAAVRAHLQDEVLVAGLEACLQSLTSDRLVGLLKHASELASKPGRIVIYGLGRNAQTLLQTAHRLGIEVVLTDDQWTHYGDDPRRINPEMISSSDVVIVTPLSAQSIFETLKTINPKRVLSFQDSAPTASC